MDPSLIVSSDSSSSSSSSSSSTATAPPSACIHSADWGWLNFAVLAIVREGPDHFHIVLPASGAPLSVCSKDNWRVVSANPVLAAVGTTYYMPEAYETLPPPTEMCIESPLQNVSASAMLGAFCAFYMLKHPREAGFGLRIHAGVSRTSIMYFWHIPLMGHTRNKQGSKNACAKFMQSVKPQSDEENAAATTLLCSDHFCDALLQALYKWRDAWADTDASADANFPVARKGVVFRVSIAPGPPEKEKLA